jgi:hypothetical protein
VNQINDGKMKTQPAQPPSGRIAHLFIHINKKDTVLFSSRKLREEKRHRGIFSRRLRQEAFSGGCVSLHRS